MDMRINTTGEDQFSGCIYLFIGLHRQIPPDRSYGFAFNKYIGDLVCISSDNPSVFNR